jgi:AcrR family transcriptional regulator
VSIPKRKTRAEQAADIRVRLLAAARTVFLRAGYHGASLDEVVRIAGLTKGAVYSRFASKAELFLALLEERVTMRNAEVRKAADAGAGGVDAMFRQWLDRTRGDEAWALLVLEFRIAASRDRELNARYAAIHGRVVAAVAEQAALAAKAGNRELEFPPEVIARAGLGFSNGLLLEQAAGARISDALAEQINARLFDAMVASTSSKGRRR